MRSHCQLPTVQVLAEGEVRVFFASRAEDGCSRVGFVELSLAADGVAVGRWSQEPALAPGPTGCFDEHGVYPSCLVPYEGRWYLYYAGWLRGAEAPLFYAAIGLAVSDDGERFERCSPAPLLDRSEHDPCLVTSPHVYLDHGRWRMTYVSGLKWTRAMDGRLQSHYHIKAAEGDDPFRWRRTGRVAVELAAGETNVARSWVLPDGPSHYRMWYCHARDGAGYRLGYAESSDGSEWRRLDARFELDDPEARAYPCVFRTGGETWLLYNRERFGAAGFGVARLSA